MKSKNLSRCRRHRRTWDFFYIKINKEESIAYSNDCSSSSITASRSQASIDIKYVSVSAMFCDQHRLMGTHLIASLCNFLAALRDPRVHEECQWKRHRRFFNHTPLYILFRVCREFYLSLSLSFFFYFYTRVMVWCVVSDV